MPAGIWLSLQHPLLTLYLVGVFLATFLWISPKVFRLIRLQVLALVALARRPAGRARAAAVAEPWRHSYEPAAATFRRSL